MKKSKTFIPSFGYSSFLFIFLLLCLVTFSVLTYVTARSDQNLTAHTATRTKNYYHVCNSAQMWLSNVDGFLFNTYHTCDSKSEYDATCAKYLSDFGTWDEKDPTRLSHDFIVNNTQTLSVSIRLLYPNKEQNCFYQIDSWELVTRDPSTEYDEHLHLFGTSD